MKRRNINYYYLVMIIIIACFNINSIFNEILFLDDFLGYSEGLNNNQYSMGRFKRSLVNPFIRHLVVDLLSISPVFSRTFILLVFIIPSALLSFNIYNRYLNLNKNQALFSATIPYILPNQLLIPFFVVGSYNTWGFMFYFVSTLSLFRYIKEPKIISLFLYLISLFIAIEVTVNVFLVMPILFLIVINFKSIKNKWLLVLLTLLIPIQKTLIVFLYPFASTKVSNIGLNRLTERGPKIIEWSSLVNFENGIISSIWYIIICSIPILILISFLKKIKADKIKVTTFLSNISNDKYLIAISFFTILLVATIMPPFISHFFSSRYVFPVGIGLYPLLSLLFVRFLPMGSISTLKKLGLILSLFMIVGIFKLVAFNDFIKNRPKTYEKCKACISDLNTSLKSNQVLLTGSITHGVGTGSHWHWSTGYLQYLLKSNKISGQVGKERFFYEPFGKSGRSFKKKSSMSGFDVSQNLKIIEVLNDSCRKIPYILSYNIDDSSWIIYDVTNDSIAPVLFQKGIGNNTLNQFVLNKAIRANDIFGFNFERKKGKKEKNISRFVFKNNKTDSIIILESELLMDIPIDIANVNSFDLLQSLKQLTEPGEFTESNLISNGKFDSNIKGWRCWSKKPNECEISWTKIENNGCLSITNLGNKRIRGISPTFPIEKDSIYLLSFNVQNQQSFNFSLKLRYGGPKYDVLKTFKVSKAKGNHHIVKAFRIENDGANLRLDFEISENLEQLNIDNIDIVKVSKKNALTNYLVHKLKENGVQNFQSVRLRNN